MKRMVMSTVALIAVLIVPSTAFGSAASVKKQAESLGVGATQEISEAHEATLAKGVKQAEKAGEDAALFEAAQSDPEIAGDLLRKSKGVQGEKIKPKKETAPVADAVSCYGTHAWNEYYLYAGPVHIAKVRTDFFGWCGIPNQRVTSENGPYWEDYTWGPYCSAGVVHDAGLNGSSWYFTINREDVGVSYVWGCLGLRTISESVRLAPGGYWDTYEE